MIVGKSVMRMLMQGGKPEVEQSSNLRSRNNSSSSLSSMGSRLNEMGNSTNLVACSSSSSIATSTTFLTNLNNGFSSRFSISQFRSPQSQIQIDKSTGTSYSKQQGI
jgi:hypothetical protein